MRTIRKLFDQLLNAVNFDLQSSLFLGWNLKEIETRALTTNELEIINTNKEDLRHYFGDTGRIWGQMTQLHQYFKFMGRLLQSYFGIKLENQSKRKRKGQALSYVYIYELKMISTNKHKMPSADQCH
jgi:hypothetical protein